MHLFNCNEKTLSGRSQYDAIKSCKEISVDSVLLSVLLELDGMFICEDSPRRDFLDGLICLAFAPSSFVKYCSASVAGHRVE